MDESALSRALRAEQELRDSFEAGLKAQVARSVALRHHPVVPNHHFAAASAECVSCFRLGNFYAAISLSQALAETISNFVARRRKVRAPQSFGLRVARLQELGVVSAESRSALDRIWEGRNDYHHLNVGVATDLVELERKALSNVQDLAFIESELFAFEVQKGALIPTHPEYWDSDPETRLTTVFLRIDS